MNRDGCTLHEAVESLVSSTGDDGESRRLAALARQIPRRSRRTVEALPADGLASDLPTPVEAYAAKEEAAHFRALADELETAIRTLPEIDQVILRLKYWENLKVADIARRLELPQKPLYRRVERSLKQLRTELTSRESGPIGAGGRRAQVA